MSTIKELFYSGTSGLALPITKAEFPADHRDKSRLQYYASFFNSLEVNSIFYKLPRSSTITHWAESVPDNFKFTFKIPKAITHAKGLHFDPKDVDDFFKVVDSVGNKKGCLLAQFPPSFKIEKMERLQKLLQSLSKTVGANSWKLAMEFRDSSWYIPEVLEMLVEFIKVPR